MLMKSDIDILKQIHEELQKVDHPRFAQNMIDFYGHLVSRVPEDGFEQILDDNDLSIEHETAILQLQKYGYLGRTIQGISRGRIEHHVNLRGNRFLEIADNQVKAVVVDKMHDSGERETFETGAVRDTADGKPRIDLISPFAMEKLAEWLTIGARKYGERNWEKGIGLERHCQSLLRHLMKFQQGVDDGEDHLVAAFCNMMFMIHTREMVHRGVLPESLLDMPKYEPKSRIHNNGDEPYDY